MSLASNVVVPPFGNDLLTALPSAEIELIRPHLQLVTLVLGQVLHEVGDPIGEVHFVRQGVVSLTADTGDNGQVEVGMTGRDGVTGVTVLLNDAAVAMHRSIVQVPGSALRLRAGMFRQLAGQCPGLRDLSLRYLEFFLFQTSQAAACNARHELPERLARWLLMTRDLIDTDDLAMTQEFLSYMLGVRRAGVSVVISALQAQGLIRPSRGRMTLLGRSGLEAEACTCYRRVAGARRRLLGTRAPA